MLHGTTVATNLILEGKTARTALVTTPGFRHVLEIGRQDIPRHANLFAWVKPKRPVPPARVLEVRERVGPGGVVLTPLDEASVHEVADDAAPARCAGGGDLPAALASPIPRMSGAWPRCCAPRCRTSR